jgi:hypothetical protein
LGEPLEGQSSALPRVRRARRLQQAGWEPIDAYRRLLEQYEAKKAFIVHDRALSDAVYGYFKLNFVYADQSKARFYFEKPYWERSEAELKAAGFR